jgi:hypothetical protein
MRRLILAAIMIFLLGNKMVVAQTMIRNQNYETLLKTRGEVYFRFSASVKQNQTLFQQLSSFLSIDRVDKNYVYAYANSKGFLKFLKLDIKYQLLKAPSMLLSPKTLKPVPLKATEAWDFYPGYNQYVSIMNQFQTSYPQLCKVVDIGKTVDGRELLFAHIESNKYGTLNKPQFMYTSSMHGDEVTGYVLMLHLIDYLLSNYGKIPQVTNLVDSLDIWINPLANPDGTYASGDTSVYGATRFNANGIDLNRNYPDPQAGQHPDGNSWQPETQAFMNFAKTHHFVMSCNMHGGNEVANYPWDTWSFLTADDAWWQYVCRQYADSAQAYSPSGYFTDENNGITDGYAWYTITGGRQDYMNYFMHDREFTLELSTTKMPTPSTLPSYWNYNYRSFLDYMHQALDGVRGVVTDSISGEAVKADVFVDNHDTNNSDIYSDTVTGAYFRPIKGGTYNITYSAPGYVTKTLKNIAVQDESYTVENVKLKPSSTGVSKAGHPSDIPKVFPNPVHASLQFRNLKEKAKVTIYSFSGKPVLKVTVLPSSSLNVGYLPKGIYLVEITVKGQTYIQKILLN